MGDNYKLNMQLVNVVNDEKSSFEVKEKKVKYLLFLGADIETRANTTDNKSLLCMMIEKGDEKMAQLLIKSGADVLNPEVLFEAKKKGDDKFLGMVKKAIFEELEKQLEGEKAGVYLKEILNVKDRELSSEELSLELWNMVKAGDVENASKLIEQGADLSAPEKKVEYYILEDEAKFESVNEGDTVLIYACKHGSYEMVELLLSKGADANQTSFGVFNPYSPYTFDKSLPIFEVIENGDMEKFKLLLKYGARADEEIFNGYETTNPLLIAIEKDRTEMALILVQNGADVNSSNGWSGSALSLAFPNYEIMEALLKNGANVNEETAYFVDNEEIESSLFIDIIKRDSCDKKMVEMFLKYGANIDEQDDYGKTALDYAKELKRDDLVEVLEKAKSKNVSTSNLKNLGDKGR